MLPPCLVFLFVFFPVHVLLLCITEKKIGFQQIQLTEQSNALLEIQTVRLCSHISTNVRGIPPFIWVVCCGVCVSCCLTAHLHLRYATVRKSDVLKSVLRCYAINKTLNYQTTGCSSGAKERTGVRAFCRANMTVATNSVTGPFLYNQYSTITHLTLPCPLSRLVFTSGSCTHSTMCKRSQGAAKTLSWSRFFH